MSLPAKPLPYKFDDPRGDRSAPVPSQRTSPGRSTPTHVLDAILNRIEAEKRDADGRNVLFFWSNRCIEYADYLTHTGMPEPLLPAQEAERMILGPMDAYHRAHGIHHHDGPSGIMPGAPTLDEALSGLRTVVDNALHSTDWERACRNLAVCAAALAAFTNSVEDERHELSNENDMLVSEIRCYMENVARYADSATASIALDEIVKAAYEPDIQFYDPVNAAMLLASATAFARHDDKTIWAYDVIDTALERFGERHDADLPHEVLVASRRVLRRYMLMVAYDGRRLAGDDAGCAALWREHPDEAPLALMRVVTLLDARAFREARDATESFLRTVTDRSQADAYIMHNGLLPEALPHGWRTILECCAEGSGDVVHLAELYRGYIVDGNDKRDAAYVNRLRRLLRSCGESDASWHDETMRLARRCAMDITERITSRSETTATYGGRATERSSSWRNPAYEKLIVDERLTDDAVTYCAAITHPSLPLLKTLAIGHPDKARETILNAMPQGALSEDDIALVLHAGTADSPGQCGDGYATQTNAPHTNTLRSNAPRLNTTRATYRRIAKQLQRYADVFDDISARRIADLIIRRHPNRPALREELAGI
ncbi:hypothetical protein [Bifidobacterium aesculapii]|uniref:hypothetical protein n=1 Tax=Bifidobacterium aesculapii TaxID=1329411 RepID=UPI0006E23000|nr:hypothetical protein [Bifidobacterium aesculapii]